MNITKKYALFNFMGKTPLAVSSLPNKGLISKIFRVNDAGTAWETWDNGLFPAFSNFDPGVGYYLISAGASPSYELYNVTESLPSGSLSVSKRYAIQTWSCPTVSISSVVGPSSVYAVASGGTTFDSWNSSSIFNSISDFENQKGYIIFSTGSLPYTLYSCCLVGEGQSALTVGSGSNVASGLGMTFVSTQGNKLYFEELANYDGLPSQMSIFVSGVQVASVTFNSPYNTKSFVFEITVGGVGTKYCGNFTDGVVNF